MTETILPAQRHNLMAAEEPHIGRIITSTGPYGSPPEWLALLAARVRRVIARLAVTVRQTLLDAITSTRIAFGRSLSKTGFQKMPIGSTVAIPGIAGSTAKIASDLWRADPAAPIEQAFASR